MHKAGYQQHGFTIVELLVVIVVIGILAAITVVAYTGISQKAIVAMLQSDLGNSAQKLKLYRVEHDAYPATLDGSNCPTGPADINYCLKPSSGNTFAYSSSSPYSSFSLVATNTNGTSYRITDDTGPVLVTATPITAIAAIAGTPQVGQVLTAGALTPSGATASYQWQRATSSGGTYSDISSATSSTYTLVSGDGDVGNYIKVVATGTGSYSGTQTSAATTVVTDPWVNWYSGIAASALAGKYIYKTDLGSIYAYKTTNDAVASPQGATGLDPYYPSDMSLVSPQTNPGVDFSAYRAQNACKAISGRLPNMQELLTIYVDRATYGNNFQAGKYWSSTENSSSYAHLVYFPSGSTSYDSKMLPTYVRCVSG